MMQIPIAKPLISDEEIRAVEDVLKSGMLAQGETVAAFESDFAEYVDAKYAVAASNGTTALDMALKALDIKAGDEVITTPFTFVATANSILFQGARPVFADINGRTFNMDGENIVEKITGKTKAILGVHLFGHPFDVNAINDICEDHKISLIEDCAQAHGAEYSGRKAGSFGTGCFSFYPTKNMTTGEGGMITTDNKKTADTCKLLRSHGESQKYVHTALGYNYRMTNIQAAIGIEQLKKLDSFNKKRIENAEHLSNNIKIKGLITPYADRRAKHVYHQYVVRVNEDFPLSRDEFKQYLHEKGIGCAIHYPVPVYEQPLYKKLGYGNTECPEASLAAKEVLSLPVHPALSEDDLKYIAEAINSLGGVI